ncbi:ferric siderophore ABC transporter substrate-binding protein [Chryseobacterium formosus]|uniref:Ferric siderophore ABC transporter substrate-binding protein n=1 Tax=Chryseobacterium formosus TaxID=1537363 RepID=A0ABT3XKC0_9FLAO|nr:ferric siderophore ABC transporter substrate-binding protein [Chryseobacterium formosus]MCX8522589.1 ferric siderophore ABC transporter substrate-binding protein [Chryseobacterium formosus]
MRGYTINRDEENKDKLKSAVLSIIIWSAILIFVFIYKMKPTVREKEPEVITTMLVNFGDNRNGAGIDEPANQEGSLAAKAVETAPEPVENVVSEPKTVITPDPKPESKKTEVKDKIITGNNTKVTAPKKEDSKTNKKSTASSTTKSTKSSATTANSKTGSGDGKGNAAIGNLIKGRGTKPGSQGTGDGIGNNGDPLGGDGNGDSKVGIDRRLVGYIPGTMGRGGAQPSHSCTASGSITIAYTVDKAGNVSSARRSGGVSDPCVVSTSVAWVKKYVKAEKASVSSTGSYNITF